MSEVTEAYVTLAVYRRVQTVGSRFMLRFNASTPMCIILVSFWCQVHIPAYVAVSIYYVSCSFYCIYAVFSRSLPYVRLSLTSRIWLISRIYANTFEINYAILVTKAPICDRLAISATLPNLRRRLLRSNLRRSLTRFDKLFVTYSWKYILF